MTSWEVVGALTFIVCFTLLVLFLSWDSRNDGGFGSMWFSPDNSRDVDIDNVNSENPTSLVWDSVQRILKKTL